MVLSGVVDAYILSADDGIGRIRHCYIAEVKIGDWSVGAEAGEDEAKRCCVEEEERRECGGEVHGCRG